MDFEQPPKSKKEFETQIENPELAESMAYAEKPYREAAVDLAKTATGAGEAAVLEAAADNASRDVGLRYIDTEQAKLEALRRQLTGEATVEPSNAELGSSLELQAQDVIDALAQKYEKCGATVEDFELVGDTVMYTAVSGLELGDPREARDEKRSWDSIMADPEDERFVMEINGRKVDTRQGMTRELYEAFVKAKKDAGAELPDSQANTLDNGVQTFLTGEEASTSFAPSARVRGGSVDVRWVLCGSDFRGFRFRPSVGLTGINLR